jgi:hypothetical protein
MKRRAPTPDRAALAAEIAGLSQAGIEELRERWKSFMERRHQGRSAGPF